MRKTTSLYEVYVKGCRCATLEKPKRSIELIKRKSLKLFIGLRAESRSHEIGVKSNRISSRFGECLPSQVIYRPSKAERFWFMKTDSKPVILF